MAQSLPQRVFLPLFQVNINKAIEAMIDRGKKLLARVFSFHETKLLDNTHNLLLRYQEMAQKLNSKLMTVEEVV